MEDLNKTQVVLLCVLVSFVTSIGTGIITSSLLQEAPQNVTQTINRVVERTVETIVPQENPGVVTREVTVVVKEEDLVIDAIRKNRNSLVWVVENPGQTSSQGRAAIRSVGVVVKADGTILADKRFVSRNGSYNVIFFSNSQVYPVTVSETDTGLENAVFLTPTVPVGTQASFTPVVIGDSDNILLGQTVIAMGGKEKDSVAIGRINSVNRQNAGGPAGSSATSTSPQTVSLETDTPLRDLVAGSILINLKGEVVGFENFDAAANRESLYTAINRITSANVKIFE
jgi:hypothetical protein